MDQLTCNLQKVDVWHKEYCDWFTAVNSAEKAMFFRCPADAYMAGLRSVYVQSTVNPFPEDRV